jgi:hypothetical protein
LVVETLSNLMCQSYAVAATVVVAAVMVAVVMIVVGIAVGSGGYCSGWQSYSSKWWWR